MSGAGISSTASVQQPPPAHVASDDPTWKYCSVPDPNKKNALKCNFCDKICTNGVTRIKFHLACIKGFNVKPCPKVPSDVKKEMTTLLLMSNDAREKKVEALENVRGKVNLDHSEGEESDDDNGNAIVMLKSKPSTSSLKSGSIDKFYRSSTIEESVQKKSLSEKTQTKLSTQEREVKRNRACEYICQFFYEASIPHNAVTLPSFACMLEAVGRFGKDLQGPSAYEMTGPFLQKRKKKVMDTFKSHRETWELTGCTVMTDAWTDRKHRGVMNLVVHSAHGALFLNSVDCSAVKKDGRYIFELVDQCIEDIGAEKVIQVVTDNASVNIAAANLLKAKRPSIFWNGCAAHTIDLMLEDIGNLAEVDKTITQARQLTVFLYAHIRVLALMRSVLKKDLVRSSVTRFATAYLNLKSLQDNKNGLQKLFRSDELHEMGYLKKDKGDKAKKVVKSEAFWKRVDISVDFFEPMANVLRRMDSDVPAMGFFYGCMLDAKKEILLRFDNDESRCKSVLDIIDNRWDNKLKKPLHLAAYFLNPYYYYPNKVQIEKEGKFRAAVITCITTMIEEDDEQDAMIEELKTYRARKESFGTDIATRQRKNKNFDPATWWLNHGTSSPNLKNLAVKILSMTCSSSACERNFSAFEHIPVLIHNGVPVCESNVIVEYIDEAFAGPSILSADPYERAIARFWAAYVDDKLLASWATMLFRGKTEEEKSDGKKALFVALETLEGALAKCSDGKVFFGGASVGLVDLALGSQLSWLKAAEVMSGEKFIGGDKTPLLAAWMARFSELNVAKAALPDVDKVVEFAKMRQARMAAAAAAASNN